eukprot:830340-Amphidinium_carterae.1
MPIKFRWLGILSLLSTCKTECAHVFHWGSGQPGEDYLTRLGEKWLQHMAQGGHPSGIGCWAAGVKSLECGGRLSLSPCFPRGGYIKTMQ